MPEYPSAGGTALTSPAFAGTPTAPTASAGTNTTQLATTAFVSAEVMTFNPLNYGAAGNGVNDDTTALQNCFAAAIAAGGTIDLGTYTFLTSSAISLTAGNFVLKGSSAAGGGIVNHASDIFAIPGTASNWVVRDCQLTASAGHIFNCAANSGVSFGHIIGVQATVTNANYAIWYMPNGTYLDMLVGDGCFFQCSASATVSPFTIISTNNAVNACTFRRLRVLGNAAPVYFFHIENQGAGGYNSDVHFSDITAEICTYGILSLLSCTFASVENLAGYDVATYQASLINIGTGAGSNRSGYITIRNSGRRGGALAAGAYDVQAASNVVALLLENVGPESGVGVYSVPAGGTTILSANALTVGSIALNTPLPVTSGGSGASTAAAALTALGAAAAASPAFTGTPTAPTAASATNNTQLATTAFVKTAVAANGNDPLVLGQAQTFLPSASMSSQAGVANTGWYYRLLSGGYAISNIDVSVATSSGNICVAAYQATGSGASAKPGTQYQTSGSVACPAAGAAVTALGGSCTPALTDWLALGCDNSAAAFYGSAGVATGFAAGGVYEQTGLTGAVLPAPAGTLVNTTARNYYLRGQ